MVFQMQFGNETFPSEFYKDIKSVEIVQFGIFEKP